MVKERSKYTQGEILVIAVLSIQFFSYIFSIFGNPIKAGFALGQKVEAMNIKFENHYQCDTLFKSSLMVKIQENTSSISILRHEVQDIKLALDRIKHVQ